MAQSSNFMSERHRWSDYKTLFTHSALTLLAAITIPSLPECFHRKHDKLRWWITLPFISCGLDICNMWRLTTCQIHTANRGQYITWVTANAAPSYLAELGLQLVVLLACSAWNSHQDPGIISWEINGFWILEIPVFPKLMDFILGWDPSSIQIS